MKETNHQMKQTSTKATDVNCTIGNAKKIAWAVASRLQQSPRTEDTTAQTADDNLPRKARPQDPAAAPPPSEIPELTSVDAVSPRGEPALCLGEGDEDEMAESGSWIQMERWNVWAKFNTVDHDNGKS